MPLLLLCCLLQFSSLLPPSSAAVTGGDVLNGNSIVFTTLGRSFYAFDIFTLPADGNSYPSAADKTQITDGQSVNFNGYFPSPSSSPSLISLLTNQSQSLKPDLELVYVTERDGISRIFYDAIFGGTGLSARRRSELEIPHRLQISLLDDEKEDGVRVSFKDRPSLSGDYLVYVSTHEDPGESRTSWAAVYSRSLKSGITRRLTPYGIADFSPSVSPSGIWTAVASYGEKGWAGEVEELSTDLYIFLTRDGTRRVKVVEHGGWPCWADDSTLYFHRRGDDQWLSIYRAILPSHGEVSPDSVKIERLTPPGLHVFTPATSPANKNLIAVATRRPDSSFRHIELFNLVTREFKELTKTVSPKSHHFNPFISADGTSIGYHKCRGDDNGRKNNPLFLENVRSPVSNLSLFRIAGSFPSFSPAGDRIAYANFPGLYVINRDGSNRRVVFSGAAFSTAWDPVREGVVYTSAGPDFAAVSSEVDIIAVNVDDDERNFKKLTTNGVNNAFPSPSPDGKWIVFRSGRTGYKNLYIMDAVDGERKGLRRLTEGKWTDTMCSWSPDGDWIAFSSDRDNPGAGSFDLFLIHPNGTGLRKLFQSGSAGRANHPNWSPDGKVLVFTTDNAGISAEPISNPHHYQPYGEIYTIKLDGSDLQRLTHNSYEDGTPTWSPRYISPVDVESIYDVEPCGFEDCHWLNQKKVHNDIRPILTGPRCSP